jgi:hypothetical protein
MQVDLVTDPSSFKITKSKLKQWEPTHETSETREGPWNAALRMNLDQHVLRCVNVHLQMPGFVQWAIHQSQQHLVADIWTRILNVPPPLAQLLRVIIAIQQLVTIAHLDRFERCTPQNHYHTLLAFLLSICSWNTRCLWHHRRIIEIIPGSFPARRH